MFHKGYQKWGRVTATVVLAIALFSLVSEAQTPSTSHRLAASSEAVGIALQYASGVSPESRDEVTKDLNLLQQMNWSEPSGELLRLTHIDSNKAMTLQQQLRVFLAERMHYILDSNHSTDATVMSAMPLKEFVEPQLGQNESSENDQDKDGDYFDEPSANQTGTVMVNIGTMIYISGIKNKNLQSLHISGIGPVVVKSPRVGIFKIGPGFFTALPNEGPMENLGDSKFLHQAFRLSTMFHEARHTDGNAGSLGFLHSVCPQGHPYEGLAACDTPSNGPYRLGALVLSSIENNCKNCSQGMKDALEILRNDSLSRIQSRIPGPRPVLTKEQKKICANNIFAGDAEDFCGGGVSADSAKNRVLEWDARPEEVR